MRWVFRKPEPEPEPEQEPITSYGDFSVGDVVSHKVTGVRMVIVAFDLEAEYGPAAMVAYSQTQSGGVNTIYLAEVERSNTDSGQRGDLGTETPRDPLSGIIERGQ